MNSRGMTLIELMIVLGVVGILAAVAVPQFANYRKSAYGAAARSDLRNAAVAQEAYFNEHSTYTESLEALKARGVRPSPGIDLKATVSGPSFTIVAKAAACAPGTGEYVYSSQTGRVDGEDCK